MSVDIKEALESESQKQFVLNLIKNGVSTETIVTALGPSTGADLIGVSVEEFDPSKDATAVIASIESYNGYVVAQEGLREKLSSISDGIKRVFGVVPSSMRLTYSDYQDYFKMAARIKNGIDEFNKIRVPSKSATKDDLVKFINEMDALESHLISSSDISAPKESSNKNPDELGWTEENKKAARAALDKFNQDIRRSLSQLEDNCELAESRINDIMFELDSIAPKKKHVEEIFGPKKAMNDLFRAVFTPVSLDYLHEYFDVANSQISCAYRFCKICESVMTFVGMKK